MDPTPTAGRDAVDDTGAPVPSAAVLLDLVPGVVGYWDRDLRNRMANRGYEEYVGLTPGQMSGLHMREVMGEEVYAANLPYATRALAGEPATFDRTLTDAQGRIRHVQASYVPDRRDDRVEGFFVLVTDVTERVDAERGLRTSLASWRALARSMPGGLVLVFDSDLRYVVADGAELATFGLDRDSCEGRLLHDVVGAELATELEPYYRAALSGRTVRWERNRGHRTFLFTAGPVLTDEVGPDDDRAVGTGMVTAQEITQRRIHERTREVLHAIATDIAKQATPEEIARRIAATLVDVFAVEATVVIRYTGPGTAEVLAVAPDHLPVPSQTLTFTTGDSSTASKVYDSGAAVLTRYDPEAGTIAAQVRASGLRSGAGCPIRHRGALWGAIVLAAEGGETIQDSVLDPLTEFAGQVELALATSESWESLERDAKVDELTGLPNRRALNLALDREVDRARRYARPLTVAMLDLDHFKGVNDRFGHAAGDQVLKELGERMRATSRGDDVLARLGGEEFAWLMPETSLEAGSDAAERFRSSLEQTPFAAAGRLTVSIGMATLESGMRAADLLALADKSLYLAKRGGRNRVDQAVATADPPSAPHVPGQG